MQEGPFSPHSRQHSSLTVCKLFGDGHSNWSEVMPLCSFDFDFSNNEQSWASTFSCACWPSVCFLWRNVYLGLLPIFLLGCWSFVVELYELFDILETEFCWSYCFWIFSHILLFCKLSFCLVVISSAVQKLVSVTGSSHPDSWHGHWSLLSALRRFFIRPHHPHSELSLQSFGCGHFPELSD